MDEIFDRIKAIKIKKTYLVASLIVTEIIGIIVFAWILKTPLYEKFLIVKPKAYSLSQMDSQKRYRITQGDYLTDYSVGSKTVILIWENKTVRQKAKIKHDFEGKWTYQFSPDLQPGVKILTVGELDDNNNILSIKNYRIRVRPRDLLDLSKIENREGLVENIVTAQDELVKAASDINTSEIVTSALGTGLISQPEEE